MALENSAEKTAPDLKTLLPQVCAIAAQAGVAIMDIYHDSARWAVQEKADESPLTAADLAANDIIVAALRALTPHIPIISEECEQLNFNERAAWQLCWMVDPLDGTKEFIARNDEFSVNIALIQNNRAVLGVVYAPATKKAYYAARGEGAFCASINPAGECTAAIALQAKKLPQQKERVINVVASRRHKDEREAGFLEKLKNNVGDYEISNAGSAFKICAVAAGMADVYPRFGPTMEWDTAAGQVVVEEAGGALVDGAGRPFLYNARESLLNGRFLVVGDNAAVWEQCWR